MHGEIKASPADESEEGITSMPNSRQMRRHISGTHLRIASEADRITTACGLLNLRSPDCFGSRAAMLPDVAVSADQAVNTRRGVSLCV